MYIHTYTLYNNGAGRWQGASPFTFAAPPPEGGAGRDAYIAILILVVPGLKEDWRGSTPCRCPCPEPLEVLLKIGRSSANKERQIMQKGYPRGLQLARDLQGAPDMTLRTPSKRWSGKRLENASPARASDQTQRTKARGLNPNPNELARSTRNLTLHTPVWKCHSK